MIVREGFLHTFITGNLKYEKTPDKIYSEQPEVKKKIEELQKKAKEKSDKNTTYYVRVDSKNKTVTLESSPTTKNPLYHVWNDVIKGPVIGTGNLVEAERLTWTGHPIKGALKRLEGIGNIYGMYTLGLGSFLGDFADRYTPGELQYGTSEEVGRRQKTENLAVKLPTDILVSRAVNGFVLKQFKMNKAGNTVKESSNKVVSNLERKSEWNIENKPLNYTAVKNSEGNYTLGRNNEWSVNNTVTSVKKMETSGLNDVYKVEINNGITPNYAIVNGQNFLTMKEYNNIATKMSDSIKPLNAIKDPVLNVETVREYLADNSYIKSKFLKENKLTVAIGKITLSDGTTENVIAVNGWDGKVWKNGKIPNTIFIETMDNQIFKVIKDDNPSLKKFDNWNHAEKKIASYAQDNYSGKISKIEISVQNNSLIFPGMCEGCNKSMFATGKDK